MKIVNGIVYATKEVETLEVVDVKPLENMMLIVTFNNDDTRLYDATKLLSMPAFLPLKDASVFSSCKVIDGIVTWMDGEIDIAPETMYEESFKYEMAMTD